MNTPTPMQQAFLDMDNDGSFTRAVETGFFYAVAINTLCGYSLGSTEFNGLTLPNLFATREQAQADIDDDMAMYAEQQADGERDDDDEFEGELVAVLWQGGESLTIIDADDNFVISETTVQAVTGL